MPKKNHALVVILLVVVAFLAGGVLSPGRVLSEHYSTCRAGIINLHQPGLYRVKVDSGMKLAKIEKSGDDTVYLTVAKR